MGFVRLIRCLGSDMRSEMESESFDSSPACIYAYLSSVYCMYNSVIMQPCNR